MRNGESTHILVVTRSGPHRLVTVGWTRDLASRLGAPPSLSFGPDRTGNTRTRASSTSNTDTMFPGGVTLLCLCLSATQLLQHIACLEPQTRARLEAKVVSSMSLRDIEAMVENDERVTSAPKSRYLIVPKGKNSGEAFIIHRKPSPPNRRSEYGLADTDLDIHRRYEPAYGFDNEFGREADDFQSLFRVSDLESAHSMPIQKYYESIVDSVMNKQKFGLEMDPFAALETSASEAAPRYTPRFDYEAYSKDSTADKLEGKPYWKDAPERRDETVDENGCRTVVKRIVDPEKEKSGDEKAKSVVITKECEYPTLSGPDAKIVEAAPFRQQTSRYDTPASSFSNYDAYEKTRPKELDVKQTEGRDPLQPDYIDSMLEKHFKSFSNPLSSFRGFQERFKLQMPEPFKNSKPTIGVQTYEYSHPKSGFDEEKDSSSEERHEYPQHREKMEYADDRPTEKSSDDPEEAPKMLKKSFAYYRKDNPKTDPDDHQYAEEYAHGNYRSFSSSYDSEKDGPKKQQ